MITPKTASFRGRKFSIESHEHESGRRAAKHQYPKHDEAFLEDLGQKSREFSINGFVSGSQCRDQRDRLLSACEEEGSGELIHPHYGKRTVVCTGCRVSESALERGIIYFAFQFTESGPPVKIDLIPSFLKNLSAFELMDNVSAFIESNYDTLDGSVDTLAASTELFEKSLSPIIALNSSLTSFNEDRNDFKNHIKDLSRTPGKCIRTLAEMFSPLSSPGVQPSQLLSPIEHAFSKEEALGGDIPLEFITPEQRQNLDVIIAVRLIAVSSLLQSESLGDLEDEDWFTLFQIMDDSLEETSSDEIFLALERMRAELVNLINSIQHKKKESIHLMCSLPSLVLSYQLYGSLDKEGELLALNSIENPCFLGPGGIIYVAL